MSFISLLPSFCPLSSSPFNIAPILSGKWEKKEKEKRKEKNFPM